jgi:predicted RNase H-like HicB family nuclease
MKTATFQMVIECPHCDDRQDYSGQSGAMFCGECTESFSVGVPPEEHPITNNLPMNANLVNDLAGHVRDCTISVWWSAEDQAWIAAAINLPGCVVHGETIKHAAGRLEGAIKDWLDCYREANAAQTQVPPGGDSVNRPVRPYGRGWKCPVTKCFTTTKGEHSIMPWPWIDCGLVYE